jgi:hypothetical protein
MHSTNTLILDMIAWFTLTIPVFGVPGNIILFIVYSTKSLRNLSISIYFRCIAIINIIICIYYTTAELLDDVYSIMPMDYGLFLCKFDYFRIYKPIVVWIEMAINLDRMRQLIFSRKFTFTTKTSFQIAVVLAIVVYNVAYYIRTVIEPRMHNVYMLDNANSDYFIDDLPSQAMTMTNLTSNNLTIMVMSWCYSPNARLYYYMDLPNATVLPFIVRIASSLVTVVYILKIRSLARRINYQHRPKTASSNGTRQSRDTKFAITVISVDVAFILMTLPNEIIFSIFIWSSPPYFVYIIELITIWLSSCYYASNFYIQFKTVYKS